MKNVEKTGALLRDHPFLRGLDPALFAELEDIANYQAMPPGTALLKEGSAADCVFFILEGTVALGIEDSQKNLRTVEELHGGDVLGWSWMIPPYQWVFDAVAKTGVRAITLDAGELRSRMKEDPALDYAFTKLILAVMAERVRAIRLEYLKQTEVA